MKLLTIAKKEINLIKSQKVALILIFLYPVLVTYLLGVSIENIDVGKRFDVVLFIEDPDLNKDVLFSILDENFNANITEVNSEKEVKRAVKERRAPVGMVFKPADTNTHRNIVYLYLDNSNLLTYRFFAGVANSALLAFSAQESSKVLSELWSELDRFSAGVEKEITTIDNFQKKLEETSAQLEQMDRDLASIDLNELNRELEKWKENIETLKKNVESYFYDVEEMKARLHELQSFEETIEGMKQDINELKVDVKEAQADISTSYETLDEYQQELEQDRNELVAVRESVQQYIEIIETLEQNAQGDIKQELAAIRMQLEFIRTQLDEKIARLDSMIISLKDNRERIKRMQERLERADAKLTKAEIELSIAQSKLSEFTSVTIEKIERTESGLYELQFGLENSIQALKSFQEKLSEIGKSLSTAKSFVRESLDAREDINAQLREARLFLTTFSEKMSRFRGYSPEYLIQPIKVEKKLLFVENELTVVLPNILAIVLLLTAMLLTAITTISEKRQGVELRAKLSDTSSFTLISGKILGQLMFAMLESTIILLIACIKIPLPFIIKIVGVGTIDSIGFGVPIAGSMLELYLAIAAISFAFISLGMLVSRLARAHSTAILASLLLIVPMLFLSGIIVPLEFTSPVIKEGAAYLPLTVANELLKAIILKGIPLVHLLEELFVILMLPIIIFIYVILKY
jgi:ABC-type multidrug transport system permease subunit